MSFEQIVLDGSLLTYALVFLGGIVTSVGPCNLASIPLVMAYVGGGSQLQRGRAFALSLSFAVGLALTFMLLGVVASLLGGLLGGLRGLGPWSSRIEQASGVVIIGVGLYLLWIA